MDNKDFNLSSKKSINKAGTLFDHAEKDDLEQLTIVDIQAAMEKGILNSKKLVEQYLDRILKYDKKGPSINSLIHINKYALKTAIELDAERHEKGPRSLLHGIPIILKDNYDTFDMPTTAGSVIFQHSIPNEDAFITKQLRKAGAIIIAKANLHEFSFGLSTNSSLGGQTFNPYDLQRNPGGSSGGTAAAIASGFATVGMGTDTGNSIRLPASFNNLVGLRPSYGLTSRSGLFPLSKTQDVGGPLGRSVTDVAVIMDYISGFYDPRDTSTKDGVNQRPKSYLNALDNNGLKGARIGIYHDAFGKSIEAESTNRVITASIDNMKKLGAQFIDIKIPQLKQIDAYVVKWEMETTINNYLQSRGEKSPVSSLESIIEKNLYIPGIDQHLKSAVGKSLDNDEYKKALNNRTKLRNVIVKKMDQLELDAILYPTVKTPPPLVDEERWEETNGWLSAHTGLPAISFPAGFTEEGLPVGVELLTRQFNESKLIHLVYSYEQRP